MAARHQWIVAQIGSRQHYAVPRGFEAIGQFKRLYTDAWCPRLLRPLLLRGNASMRAFAGRWHSEVPSRKVISHNLRAIRDVARQRNSAGATVERMHQEYLHIGAEFDNWVCRHLDRAGAVDAGADAFFGFNTGCLRTIQALRGRGVPTVLDQIDPAKVEEDIVYAESAKWPGWQALPGRVPQEYWDRLAAEWAAVDLLLVNSQWTRSALVRQGVPDDKILIVPLAYEPAAGPVPLPTRKDHPLTVLWLGSVILRKGIQYLMEAARLLADTDLKFVIVGEIGISKAALDMAPRNMSFLGRITREQTNQLYQKADMFVLPTLSDGFAVTQVEAMNRGLPVITTPNCGEVVTDGRDGLIVPPADAPALAGAIRRLNSDRALLSEMSQNAFIRSMQFLLPNQARAVDAAVQEFKARPIRGAAPVARVAVVQDGARLHYAVPVSLHRAGALHLMYSEWFLKRKPAYRLVGAVVRRLRKSDLRGVVERRCDEIPPSQVRVNVPLVLRLHHGRSSWTSGEAYYRWCSQSVGRWIRRRGLGDANVLFGFIRNVDPQLCREARNAGVVTVGDQMIAPAAVEGEEFRRQSERWPDWEPPAGRPDFPLVECVERETWEALDRITCASEYVRQGLIAQSIAPEKISVIPYPIDLTHYDLIPRGGRQEEPPRRKGPLVVGFVGAVGLRKGTPYFREVARRLGGRNLKFMMVGPVLLADAAARSVSEHVELVGRVPRSRVREFLQQFDIFLFPSTCEGSAGAAMEAMAVGLPIVTSLNSGSAVRDGIDGVICPYDDIEAMSASVQRLADDEALRLEMGRQGRMHAESLNVGWYGRRLVEVMESAIASRGSRIIA